MQLQKPLSQLLGETPPIAIDCFDGSHLGPVDSPVHIHIKNKEALAYALWAPGELGLARAWVAGDIDIEGDIFGVFQLREKLPNPKLGIKQWLAFADIMGRAGLKKPPRPEEEMVLHGVRHSLFRDKRSISYHYDVSNEFYSLLLGPSMTYSCAVFDEYTTSLQDAQKNKHDLICRKLQLEPGQRLLDVGCGWGSMLIHAAQSYDIQGVGVTISQQQAEFANKRIADLGLVDKIEVRVQDYREIDDGPYDAISSVGMFEHVGEKMLPRYFSKLESLLKPKGRLLNHGITRPSGSKSRLARRSFINRYVFPDGELCEVGRIISLMQNNGLEFRHCENLREHYDLTLREWVKNLTNNWDRMVELIGLGRAKIWLLYLAGSADAFANDRMQLNQILATKDEFGKSGMVAEYEPDWWS